MVLNKGYQKVYENELDKLWFEYFYFLNIMVSSESSI